MSFKSRFESRASRSLTRQVALSSKSGAAVLNDHLANDLRRNGTHISGTDDDRVLHARCPGSDTAEMTSAESWTSARPACIADASLNRQPVQSLKQQVGVWTSRRFQNDTRRVVLGSLELMNGSGWSAVQHRVAVIDSRENQTVCQRLC